MSKIRDAETKQAFIDYLVDHPEYRFWQAIRNFWGAPYVLVADEKDFKDGEFSDIYDTYYIEADNLRKEKYVKSNTD